MDVTPLTLGIETLGGVATPIIKRNTTIPTSSSQVFSTAADNQTSVEVHVVQGEREIASDNKSLGRFILDGIPPAPRGVPQVEVSFDMDANGILNVSAKDKATNKSQSIAIQGGTGLSKEEVERMVNEAEKYSQEDKKKKELVEARNQAENMCYTAEKTIKDAGDKITEDLKKPVEDKVKNLRDILATASLDELKTKAQELSTELQKIGQELYKQQGANKAGTSKEEPKDKDKKNPEEPVEGEVVEDK